MIPSTFGSFEFEKIPNEDFGHIKADQVFSHFLPAGYELSTGQGIMSINLNIPCKMNFVNLPKLKQKEH